MRKTIPNFENRKVHGSGIRFSGTTRRPVDAFDQGETVILVIEAEVRGVNHQERDKVGLCREHAFKVLDVQVPDQKVAREMMTELQDEYLEKTKGLKPLPFAENVTGPEGKAGKDAAAGE